MKTYTHSHTELKADTCERLRRNSVRICLNVFIAKFRARNWCSMWVSMCSKIEWLAWVYAEWVFVSRTSTTPDNVTAAADDENNYDDDDDDNDSSNGDGKEEEKIVEPTEKRWRVEEKNSRHRARKRKERRSMKGKLKLMIIARYVHDICVVVVVSAALAMVLMPSVSVATALCCRHYCDTQSLCFVYIRWYCCCFVHDFDQRAYAHIANIFWTCWLLLLLVIFSLCVSILWLLLLLYSLGSYLVSRSAIGSSSFLFCLFYFFLSSFTLSLRLLCYYYCIIFIYMLCMYVFFARLSSADICPVSWWFIIYLFSSSFLVDVFFLFSRLRSSSELIKCDINAMSSYFYLLLLLSMMLKMRIETT